MPKKNLKTGQKRENLDNFKVRLFFIKVKYLIFSYKYELVKDAKLYSVLYILVLKLANFKIFEQNIFFYYV